VVASIILAGLSYLIALLMGFNTTDSLIIAASMIFSSTIIGLKLLPTTVLHHRHIGEVIISVLLLQDLIAIVFMLLLHSQAEGQGESLYSLIKLIISLPILVIFSLLFSNYVLVFLFKKFDKILEYVFLVAIGWCLGLSEIAKYMGLSHEIGAFIAGVSIATGPISMFIAESLKPLRDFFLVIFFFAIGASFQLNILVDVLLPACVLAAFALVLKPIVYGTLLHKLGHEEDSHAKEIGFRIGQMSEFSILLGALALNVSVIGERAAYLIHVATIITFIISSYIVVFKFPSPMALSDRLRRD